MWSWLKNSAVGIIASTTISIVIGRLAAYSLARLKSFGRQTLTLGHFHYLLAGSLLFIPLFLGISNLDVLNLLWASLLSYQTCNVQFSTWMSFDYFSAMPVDLEVAALIDGYKRMGGLMCIVLPLAAVMAQRTELRTIPLYSNCSGR